MLQDTLAAGLTKLMNAERVGKREVEITPSTKVLKKILLLLNEGNYVGSFEEIEIGKGSILKVNLLGNVNKCGVIKPRFSTKKNGFEKMEKRYLPAKDFGVLLVSTSQGIMTHVQAKEKNIGGKLLAYCY